MKNPFFVFSLRVAQIVYTGREDWLSVCRCMIADPTKSHSVWPWLQRLPTSTFNNVIQAHLLALVKIDANQLGALIAARIPAEVNKILEALTSHPEFMYNLMSALYQLVQYKEENNKLELTADMLETYLELMCQFEPEKVNTFL